MREAENKVKIDGILSEIDLNYTSFTSKKDGKPVEAIGGTVKILVEQNINGEDQTLEIPVHMFSSKYTNAGTPNPAYNSIEKVKNEFVSIAACGSKEQADRVRVTRGTLTVNEFPSQDGSRLVSQLRVSSNFLQKVIGEFKPQATFSLEFVVSDSKYVTDANGIEVEPKKLEITAIVPGWNNSVSVIKLYAYNPNVINAIEQYWENGGTYKASGRLNFTSRTETIVKEVDFGEPETETRTTNVSEPVITGGSQVALDEDYAFNLDEIRAAMAQRKANQEQIMQRGRTSRQAPPQKGKAALDLGF